MPADSHTVQPTITPIPYHQISTGDNDRTVFRPEDLQTLADSIAAEGLIQPITVRPLYHCPRCRQITCTGDRPTEYCDCAGATWPAVYQIVAGERRWRAIGLLAWPTVPAIIRDLTDQQASAIMLIENVHRVDIDPIDEARAYQKRLDQFDWTIAHLARTAKVTPKRIQARLSLLHLIPDVQRLVQQNIVGVQFGECMADLDRNRQFIAFRYLNTSERPLLREFRAICNRLRAEQAQDTMFNLDFFITQTLDDHAASRTAWQQPVFPVDGAIPKMRRVGSIGLSIETYIHELLTNPDPHLQAIAPIIGSFYQAILEAGFAYPPHGPSPLRSGSQLRP